VIKTRLRQMDFRSDGAPFDVRVSLSAETDMPTQHLPAAVQPTMVRTKLRRRFDKGHWSFHLTKTWQGTNGIEVDQACKTQAPQYEIEIELIHPRKLLRNGPAELKDRLVAGNLLAKAMAVMTSNARAALIEA